MPSQYDRWLRPRPNTQWQNLENQRFIDQAPLRSAWFNEDGDISDEEDEEFGSSEVTTDDEGCTGDEEYAAGDKHDLQCISLGLPGVTDEEPPATHINLDQPHVSQHQERPAHNMNHGYVEEEDTVIEQFLRAMPDHDLHRDSIARLSRFFKTVPPEHLQKAQGESGEGQIVLEDRNFSRKTFRPYPRSMTPRQLYDALRRPVRRSTGIPRHISSLQANESTQRYPATTVSNSATSTSKLWTGARDCQVERRTL